MNSTETDKKIQALVETAERWRDPDYGPRAEAERLTLEAENHFVEASLAFAINHMMSQLTHETLARWGASRPDNPAVAILDDREVPFALLPDVVSEWLRGREVHVLLPVHSPHLLPLFFADIEHRGLMPQWHQEMAHIGQAATHVRYSWGAEDPDEHRLALLGGCTVEHFPDTFAVAVLSGGERAEEQDGLAEDVLLYEGRGNRSIRLVWAPRGIDADPYFQAFAEFRSMVPIHPKTAGRLRMQRAFLAAHDVPHAYAEGSEFLVSRSTPEPQPPGHLRWVEYDAFDEVESWLHENASRLEAIVCQPRMPLKIPAKTAKLAFGEVHRAKLDQLRRRIP